MYDRVCADEVGEHTFALRRIDNLPPWLLRLNFRITEKTPEALAAVMEPEKEQFLCYEMQFLGNFYSYRLRDVIWDTEGWPV